MARTFVTASSSKIVCTPSSSATIISRTACSLTVWFKYSDSGTTRRSLYTEDGPGGSVTTLHLSLNDGTNGQVRIARRDQSSNLMIMTYDGNLDDGNWHCVTYAATSKSAHKLFVDGVERDSDATNLSGSFDGVTSQAFGMRKQGGGAEASFYGGDMCEVILHAVALSEAEHATLYDKSKHAFNASATLPICYWPLPNIGDDLRNIVQARMEDTLPVSTNTTGADGPDGAGPTGMTESCDLGTIWYLAPMTTTLITGSATSTDVDYLLREPSNVLHTPNDTGKEYKTYIAGTPSTYAANDPSLILYYTSDPTSTWTKYGVVIDSAVLPMEDAYVAIDPDTGTYHLWAENKTSKNNQSGIAHFTSADGITWSAEDTTVLDSGNGDVWDNDDVSSPVNWVEGTPGARTWYKLFEGRKISGQRGEMGLASRATPDGNFTKYGSNPVLPGDAGGIDDGSLVIDDMVKIGSRYWGIAHVHDGDNAWVIERFYSDDLHAWTRPTQGKLTKKDTTDTLQRVGGTHFGKFIGQVTSTVPQTYKLMRGFGDTATQTTEWPPTPQVVVSGTLADAVVETVVVAGGETVILTVTGDTLVSSGATFNAQRQNIINGGDSAQAEATGWDAVVKAGLAVTAVERTSDNIITITLSAFGTYNITASETITWTIPGSALTGGNALVASPSIVITSSSASEPDAPTIGTAVATGGTTASVPFTAPVDNGGSTIISDTATSTPGSLTGTVMQAGSGAITVSGLTTDTAYTFTVHATNAVGDSVESAASNSITTFSLPDAPTIGIATPGQGFATIAFTPPVDTGGTDIIDYTATSTPDGLTGISGSSPVTVTGLATGVAYTFTVHARNVVGDGPESLASNEVVSVGGQSGGKGDNGSVIARRRAQFPSVKPSGLPPARSRKSQRTAAAQAEESVAVVLGREAGQQATQINVRPEIDEMTPEEIVAEISILMRENLESQNKNRLMLLLIAASLYAGV